MAVGMKISRFAGAALIAVSVFFTSCSTPAVYTDADLSSGVVLSEAGGNYTLKSSAQPADAPVLIFYPGGLVDEGAYLPVLSMIAAGGVEIVLVSMPLDLAVFNQNAALGIAEDYSGRAIYIAGHSLGGVMAAGVCSKTPETFSGLALWASYTTEKNDLSGSGLRVLSLRGSRDGVAAPEEIAAADYLLPADTVITVIEGGNHSGFGSYGPQKGDLEASITKDEQHRIIAESMLLFIK